MFSKYYLKLTKLCFVSTLVILPAQNAMSLTLTEALISAFETSPTLETRKHEIDGLAENVTQAKGGLRPTVSANAGTSLSKTYRNGHGQTYLQPYNLTLAAQLTLFDFGRTKNAVDQAKIGIHQGIVNFTSTEQSILLSAVTSFLDVLRDQELVTLAENNQNLIDEQLTAAKDRFEFGEVTRTDVSQAEARLAAAANALTQNKGALIRSEQNFLRATGIPAINLETPPALPVLPNEVQEAHNTALKNHPAIQAARLAEDSAREGIQRAVSGLAPTLSLDASISSQNNINAHNDDTRTATIGITGTIPIYQAGVQHSRVRQAQILVSQRRSELHDTARQVTESVAIAWENLFVARAAISASNEQIKAAEVAYDGVKEEALFGSRTTLDVLDAEQELLNARVALVTAQRDEYVAAYQLLSAVGKLTTDHLALDVEKPNLQAYYNKVKDKWHGYQVKEENKWSNSWK